MGLSLYLACKENFQAAQQAQGASPQNTAMQNQLASILGNFVQNQANRPPAVPLAQVLPSELGARRRRSR